MARGLVKEDTTSEEWKELVDRILDRPEELVANVATKILEEDAKAGVDSERKEKLKASLSEAVAVVQEEYCGEGEGACRAKFE